MKRVMLATGGTGGHIFPALAVAAELKAQHPGVEVLFVGGEGLEGKLARQAGLEFVGLPVRGVLGRGVKGLAALGRMGVSLAQAVNVVRRFKPQVAAGFGGYASVCPVMAAWILRVPTAIHEQNSVPGATNRLLGRLAKRIMVTYPAPVNAFAPGKVLFTGNPVRPEIAALFAEKPSHEGKRNILVLGGSQGARAVNRIVAEAWPGLAQTGAALWHQTGEADFDATRALYGEQTNVRVAPFITDMAEAYSWADLVVARSGASTLAEITCAGLPCVLIPFPFATHDHQTVNAASLAGGHAAVVLPEKDLNAQLLTETVSALLADPVKLADMGRAARTLAKPHAARMIAEELTRLAASDSGD